VLQASLLGLAAQQHTKANGVLILDVAAAIKALIACMVVSKNTSPWLTPAQPA
jgi:hypothetical protein